MVATRRRAQTTDRPLTRSQAKATSRRVNANVYNLLHKTVAAQKKQATELKKVNRDVEHLKILVSKLVTASNRINAKNISNPDLMCATRAKAVEIANNPALEGYLRRQTRNARNATLWLLKVLGVEVTKKVLIEALKEFAKWVIPPEAFMKYSLIYGWAYVKKLIPSMCYHTSARIAGNIINPPGMTPAITNYRVPMI